AVGARSRTALRALYALPERASRRLRRLIGRPMPAAAGVSTGADDLHAAIGILVHQPRTMLRPALHALLVEVLGVCILWSTLWSFGQHTSIALPLIGYAIATLFAIVWVLPAGIG